MYNTNPKLYSKILGKKCVLYPRFYGRSTYFYASAGTGHFGGEHITGVPKKLWYELSNNGTSRPWYELSTVRIVQRWYE